MNEEIKSVLTKITDQGYKAYVVGGYVRDYILGIESYDIDIATNALPTELNELFDNVDNNMYGGLSFSKGDYNFDITTFRSEVTYEDRRPTEFNYIDTVEEDVVRRDFTINSLYMDSDGNIIDIYNGQDDINNRIIRCIGNIKDKMVEDPLRILRALRFKIVLDFELEENLLTFIKQNKDLINSLSYSRIKEELDYIIKSSNRVKGLNYLKELKLEDVLEINIPDEVDDSEAPLCIWAQLDFSPEYPFTKSELSTINDIKSIVSYGIIDNIILYKYGLYVSQLAGDILNISDSFISEIYKELPIYSSKDIDISGDEIIELLHIEPSGIIKDIYRDLETVILNNKLNNNKEEIKKYILDNWR